MGRLICSHKKQVIFALLNTLAKKDADGHVITDFRNFTTKKMKKGHIDSVLFSKPSYISSGDLYKCRSAMNLREFSKDGFLKAGHE